MADNVTVDNGSLTDVVVASDDIGGIQYPRMKVAWGADGAAADTSATAPLPVEQMGMGTLANGAQTTVSSSAVQVIASNSNRVALMIQNVGAYPCRVGVSGVTATTGLRLDAGMALAIDGSACPTGAIFCIRDGSNDTTVLAQQITT